MHAVCGGTSDGFSGERFARPLFAGHIAGGTHHAFRDRGEGFCVFSDIAVSQLVGTPGGGCSEEGSGDGEGAAPRWQVFFLTYHLCVGDAPRLPRFI